MRELAVDAEAMRFAQAEAERLVREGVFSHHAADGSKPYQRWSRAGGTAHVRENLFRLTSSDPRAYMLFDPVDAHERLMSSAGHRAPILDPWTTALGVGIAYDGFRNSVYVVEEFVARHMTIGPGDPRWQPGETRLFRGRILEGRRLEPWMAVLSREPLPRSAAAGRQAAATSYVEGGETVLVLSGRAFEFDPAAGSFALPVTMPARASPGPYTLLLYLASADVARAPTGRRSTSQGVAAVNLAFEVEG